MGFRFLFLFCTGGGLGCGGSGNAFRAASGAGVSAPRGGETSSLLGVLGRQPVTVLLSPGISPGGPLPLVAFVDGESKGFGARATRHRGGMESARGSGNGIEGSYLKKTHSPSLPVEKNGFNVCWSDKWAGTRGSALAPVLPPSCCGRAGSIHSSAGLFRVQP